MATQKPHINLVTIGHVDHGKSTLVGRLLFEHGEIPQHIIDDYKKRNGTELWLRDSMEEKK